MFIRSERLFLRPGWDEDVREFHALIAEEALARNLASVPWPCSLEDAREIVVRPRERLLPHFFVTLPTADGARLAGSIGLGRDAAGEVELGYWIGAPFRGQGYATEAVRAVLRLAAALGHRRIVASHFADNPASARVLAKAGFAPTGITRPRFSAARGGEAVAVEHAIELQAGHGDDAPAMAA